MHKPKRGGERLSRSLKPKLGDIKVVVVEFTRCYWTIKDHNVYGKLEDDIVMDVFNVYSQKLGKSFVFKHCYVLL